jgi:O-antigen ligase
VLAVGVSVLVAEDTVSALGYAKAYFVLPGLVFLVAQAWPQEERAWRQVLLGFGALAVLLVGVATWQRFTGEGLPIPWDYDRRSTGLFPYPNALGLLLAPLASAFLVSAWRWRAPGFGVLGVVAIVGCVLAETEAALVAVPSALGLVAVAAQPTWGRRLGVLGAGAVLASAMLLVSPMREKILLQDYSGGVRRSQWGETMELLGDHPFFGVGLGGYPQALALYHQDTQYEIFQYPHNLLLNQWVELGALGVVALVWLIAVSGKRLWDNASVVAMASGAALLTMVIHGLVDVPFYKNDLAVLTALLFGIFWQKEKSPAGPVRLTDRR